MKSAASLAVLAFLQNQWFRDPDRVRQIYARHPDDDFRRRFIASTLFMGCRTGRTLERVFGDWTGRIVWEETSRDIGGHAASAFPANWPHMASVIESVRPTVILSFGAIAAAALRTDAGCGYKLPPVIYAPHPTARGADTLPAMRAAREALDKFTARA